MASAGSVVAGKTPARGGETARVNQESRETTKYTKHTKGKGMEIVYKDESFKIMGACFEVY